MTRIARLMMLHKLQRPAEDGTGQGGGGGGDGGGADDAAAKAAAEAEAAKKKAEEEAAAAAAASGKPTDAEAKLLKDVMKHKQAAQAAADALARANEQLKSFEGIDPVKIRALLTQQEEAERKELEARGEYDRLVKQMGERHTQEQKALKDQAEAERAARVAAESKIGDLTVGAAFGGSKFVNDELTLTPAKARIVYGPHFSYEDGEVVGYDKPAGAKDRTKLVNSAGDALSFEEAIKKLVEADPDKDHLLRSKVKAGAGSAATPRGARAPKDTETTPSTGRDRIAKGLREKALAK